MQVNPKRFLENVQLLFRALYVYNMSSSEEEVRGHLTNLK